MDIGQNKAHKMLWAIPPGMQNMHKHPAIDGALLWFFIKSVIQSFHCFFVILFLSSSHGIWSFTFGSNPTVCHGQQDTFSKSYINRFPTWWAISNLWFVSTVTGEGIETVVDCRALIGGNLWLFKLDIDNGCVVWTRDFPQLQQKFPRKNNKF